MITDHFTPFGARIPAPITVSKQRSVLSYNAAVVVWALSTALSLIVIGNLAWSTWGALKTLDRQIEMAERV